MFAADTPLELLRAACAQLPGFQREVDAGRYTLKVGDESLQHTDVLRQLGDAQVIRLMPVPKSAGIETIIIVGLALIVGVVLAVSLIPMAKQPDPNSRQDENKNTGVYDGPVNVTEQGHTRPLIYGRMIVGSVVVSSGIDAGGRAVGTGSGTTGLLTPGAGGGGGLNPLGGDLIVAKGGKGGGGSASATEDPNTLQSNSVARIVELIGEGEIVGLVDGLKSVYFDDTPIQNADDTYNFKGIEIEERVGTPDQTYMPGYAAAENVRVINVEATIAGTDPVVTITDPNVNVAKVTIKLPALYQQDTSNGNIKGTTVQFAFDVQANGGGYTEVINHTITGKQNSPYQETYAIRLPAGGAPWNVRMRRITADSGSSALVNKTFFDLLTEVVERKFSYPNCALIGLTADILQFGSSIPTRGYDVKGRIVRVPSNYNPVTRVYTGVWDGLFNLAWTDNPAWCFFDLLTHKRYGLGRYIDESQVDKYLFYSIGQYADELVPDGKGGTEPRYRFNTVINTRQPGRQLLAELAATFRCLTYWGTSQVTITQDRPEESSRIVSPANVVESDFRYSGSALDAEHSAFVVWWNDPENGYRLTPEIVEDKGLMLKLGWKPLEYTAKGVTSPGHARRLALFLKEDQDAARQSLAYTTGFDHSFVSPGNVVDQFDPNRTTVNWAGRTVTATTTEVALDRSVVLPAGPTYTLTVALPNGTLQTKSIDLGVTGSTATNTITVSSAFSVAPSPDAMWTIASSTLAPRPWRVRGVRDADPFGYEVVAVSHDAAKYARVENGVFLETTPWINLPTGVVQAPDGLFFTEYFQQEGNATVPYVLLSWTPSTDSRVTAYEVQFKRPGQEWEPLGINERATRDVRINEEGSHSFRVRSLAGSSFKSAWREATATLVGSNDTLPEVIGLTLTIDAGTSQTVISWSMPVDPRPLRVNVYYNTSATFGTAALIGTVDATAWLPTAVGFYWFETTFAGAVSAAPPMIEATIGDFVSGEVTFGNFAEGIEPVGVVDTLPTVLGYVGPSIVFLTTDGQLYRLTGGVWTTAVDATSIAGTLIAAQIASVNATAIAGSILAAQIGSVNASAIAGTLTAAQIASVNATAIAGSILAAQIGSVNASAIAGTLSAAQIASVNATAIAGQITTTQITNDAITSAKIAAGTIVAGDIAAGTITATQIAAATITAGNIASGTITATQIAAGAITATEIASATIVAGNIAAGAITATEIASATIVAGNIAAGAITATQIAAGTITATQIAAATITAGNIAVGTITATQIAAGAITATEIAANTITASNILANTITAGQIAVGAIGATQIATDAITAVKVAAGAITAAKITVTSLSAISANLGTITAGSLNIGSGKFVVDASGNVTIQNAASGQRLTISNSVLEVYDSGGTRRVRLGIW